MQARQVVALVTVVAIIALAFGVSIGFELFSAKTSTVLKYTTVVSNQTLISPPTTTLTNTLTFVQKITTTAVSNLTQTTTMSVTNTSTALMVVAVTTFPKTPFNYTDYLAVGSTFGGCYEDSNPEPCFTSDISGAEVFNCLTTAASISGCTTQIYSPPNYGVGSTKSSYTITVVYPYVNASQDEPTWANCKWSVSGNSAPPYGFCITISPTAFLLTIAGFPPV